MPAFLGVAHKLSDFSRLTSESPKHVNYPNWLLIVYYLFYVLFGKRGYGVEKNIGSRSRFSVRKGVLKSFSNFT